MMAQTVSGFTKYYHMIFDHFYLTDNVTKQCGIVNMTVF